MPALFRLAWPPLFDFGTSNMHKFILDFICEVALKVSEARFSHGQVEAVSDCQACPSPPYHQRLTVPLAVSALRNEGRPSLGQKAFISSTRRHHVPELHQVANSTVASLLHRYDAYEV